MWLSIRSNEMMRDSMKAFIKELKEFNIAYESYGAQRRIYLKITEDFSVKNEYVRFREWLYRWMDYHPISMVKRPKNISDYDRVDW